MQSSRLLVATALVAMFAWSTAVSAQDGAPAAAAYADIDIELDVMPDDLARRLDQEPAAVIAADLGMQGAILATRRWNPGDVVTVCFWTGTQVLRQRIAQAAAPWNDAGANIRLDFGDANDPRLCRAGQTSDIRVGFGFPGYWSLLGRDSIISAGPNETTLNLANFNYVTPEESEFNRIVLHEFGHALGFIHEHQHPSASCEEEFNWPVIYTRLGGPPNNWPREKVDHNMRAKRDYYAQAIATDFDLQSIMLYTFPAEYYLTGVNSRCYAPRNTALSERDRQALRTAYPTATPDQIAAGRAQAASAILEAAAADNNPRGFAGRPDSRRYFTTRIALSQLSTDQLRMLSASTSAPLTTLDFANSGVAIAADNATWRDLTSDRYFERRNNALRVRTADQLEGALGRTASRANVAQ